jgi:UDP-glucose 4-epimerase
MTGGQKRVVVVGAGFLGSHVVEALVAAGHPTRAVTRSAPREAVREALASAELVVGDVRERDVLAEALAGAAHVVLCAGGLTPADSHASPLADLDSALGPVLAVLGALRSRPGVGVTYLSSGGTVYGEPRTLPLDEAHATNPLVPYGISKLACEKHVALHGRLAGAPVRILRVSNAYGERQPADRNQGAVAVFLDRVSRGEQIVVVGEGVRDYIYAGDVASVVVGLLDVEAGPAVLNVGSGVGTSLDELVGLIEEVTGLQAIVERTPPRAFDLRWNVLDVSQLRELLDFRPLSLDAGLERTWAGRPAAAAVPR